MNYNRQIITDNSIEREYMASVPLAHRKKFAQFFTPFPVAELLTQWLLGNPNLQTIQEPAFGLGIFSRLLLSQRNDLTIKAFEIDPTILTITKKYFADIPNVKIFAQDYMENDWQNKYDGIICNPPYFKFHNYDNKAILKTVEEKLHCPLTGFTNLYTLFLLKSLHQLKPNGRCAYLVPSEFLNSNYGEVVKSHLLKTGMLRHVIVIDFSENVFDDALTTASIILCENSQHTKNVTISYIQSLPDLHKAGKIFDNLPFSKTYQSSELQPKIKWKAYYQPQNCNHFKHLVPFSTYAKVVRGIATGSNEYFTFTQSKAKEFSIEERFLLPCICKAVDARGAFFTQHDFATLKQNDKKIYLFNANVENSDNEFVLRYIKKGEAEGIDKTYLNSRRTPWYSLERRPPAPIWVGVFNRAGLRFIRNEANIANLTAFHCVYPQSPNLLSEMDSGIDVDLLFAYLLTNTAKQILTDNSREYGDGLQKFEPNDINKGMMLDLAILPQSDKNEIATLYRQFQKQEQQEQKNCYIDKIDKILKEYFTPLAH
jgi:adenine-specific DNA-methyltransferase